MIDDDNTASQPPDPIMQYKPPQYLVRETMPATSHFEDQYHEADTPEEAMAKAREIAAEDPGMLVDIYHHALTVRAHPPVAAEPG